MSEWDKHQPATYSEFLLCRIADSLELLTGQTNPTPPQTAVLKEVPVPAGLPDDIPHRDKLTAAGITTLKEVPKKGDQLIKIDGIGKASANQIITYLKLNK